MDQRFQELGLKLVKANKEMDKWCRLAAGAKDKENLDMDIGFYQSAKEEADEAQAEMQVIAEMSGRLDKLLLADLKKED